MEGDTSYGRSARFIHIFVHIFLATRLHVDVVGSNPTLSARVKSNENVTER
jgi:hypothetical protein